MLENEASDECFCAEEGVVDVPVGEDGGVEGGDVEEGAEEVLEEFEGEGGH